MEEKQSFIIEKDGFIGKLYQSETIVFPQKARIPKGITLYAEIMQ